MECATEQNPCLSPMCRARCNTWHAGLNEVSTTQCSPSSDSPNVVTNANALKKPSSRRNAWGQASYADLIAAAIDGAPDRRLTLSQIYDWMVTNVPYFKEKADSVNSAGWKNSIRHNLSLHRRFVRIPHADGKSAWWTLNQAEVPASRWSRTLTSRRRADSMDVRTIGAQHRPRRGRKPSGTDSLVGDRDRHSRITSPHSAINCTEEANCNLMQENFAIGSDHCATSHSHLELHSNTRSPFGSFSYCSGFDSSVLFFPPVTTAILGNDVENLPSARTSSDDLSQFSLQRQSPINVSLHVEVGCVADDEESSSCMMTQLSPTWDQPVVVAPSLDDGNYATNDDNKISDLFSDVAMSYDDFVGLQLDESSAGDCFVLDSQSGSQQSIEFNLRRGSDAPPPSPEYECNARSIVLDDEHANNRLWSSVLSSKFNELSNSSDMDTDH